MLDAETERRELQIEDEKEALFADDLLPGVGGDQLTLKQGVKIGGVFAFVMLLLIQSVDELENAVLSVLAPDIRDSSGSATGRSCSSAPRRAHSSCSVPCRWGGSPTGSAVAR